MQLITTSIRIDHHNTMSGLNSCSNEAILHDFTSNTTVVTELPPAPATTPHEIAMYHRFLTACYGPLLLECRLFEPAEEEFGDDFYVPQSCVPTDSDDDVPELMEAPPLSAEENDRETRLAVLLGHLDRDGDEETMYPVHAGN